MIYLTVGNEEDQQEFKRDIDKRGHPYSLHCVLAFVSLLKISQEIWVIPERFQTEKRGEVDLGYTFLRKLLNFLDLSLYPWKFQIKQAFIPGNSACKLV